MDNIAGVGGEEKVWRRPRGPARAQCAEGLTVTGLGYVLCVSSRCSDVGGWFSATARVKARLESLKRQDREEMVQYSPTPY
jgi:hypothetical protein